jgi:alkylation response protein AidB-like acyl-CoA dehydrogenase
LRPAEALIDGSLDPEQRAFRAEVRAFLRETADQRSPLQVFADRGGATARLYEQLGAKGWLSIAWPTVHGGSGMPLSFEFLLWDELAFARAARPPVGAGMIARSIIEWGTPGQHAMFLPGIRTGTEGYSLGYSEPEAGSDLTGLRTRAVRDGDVYRVTGEKRWTSDAHVGKWLWLLCRTGAPDSRSRGLSLLIVDLTSPGISISPIETIDGHRLNEVRLDDVIVPETHRIGAEGDAWSMIRQALARERHLQVLPGRIERDLEMLSVIWKGLDQDERRGEQNTVTSLFAAALAVRAATLETVLAATHDEVAPLAAAQNKVVATELMQDIARYAARLGDGSALAGAQPLSMIWRESILETIAGGATEIMLETLARSTAASA